MGSIIWISYCDQLLRSFIGISYCYQLLGSVIEISYWDQSLGSVTGISYLDQLLGSVQIQAQVTINKMNICRRIQTSISKYKKENFFNFHAISLIRPKRKMFTSFSTNLWRNCDHPQRQL